MDRIAMRASIASVTATKVIVMRDIQHIVQLQWVVYANRDATLVFAGNSGATVI